MSQKQTKMYIPVTNMEWEEVMRKLLASTDNNGSNAWEKIEKLEFQPYYRADVLGRLYDFDDEQEDLYYKKDIDKPTNWDICVTVSVDVVKAANKRALQLVNNGVTFLGFDIRKELTIEDFQNLLEGLDLEKIGINFYTGNRNGWYTNLLSYYADKEGFNKKKIYGSDDFDSFGHMLKHGEFPCKHEECFCAHNRVDMLKNHMQNFKLISINARNIHSAGGTVVQELGYGLAMAAQYFDNINQCRLTVDELAKTIKFNFAVGSNYFFEIAKLRAARILWAKIVESFKPECEDSKLMYIHCETSSWNKSIYDPHINILRTSTEAIAAITGGTDTLSVVPFDRLSKKIDKHTERLAKNILLILKEEECFEKTKFSDKDNFFIETLTNIIAEKAMEIYNSVQESGGFLEAFKNGIIQKDIEKTTIKRNMDIAMKTDMFIGHMQYTPPQGEFDELEFEYTFSQKAEEGYLGQALKEYRGIEDIEKLRILTDISGKKPVVYNLISEDKNIGKQKAKFSSEFFGCAGFEVVDSNGAKNIEEALGEANSNKADIIVLCASDENYKQLTTEVQKKAKDKIIVVAGNPKTRSELEEAGIRNFIHSKTNLLVKLKYYQEKLGIIPMDRKN
jgi:methylmalonyl-CoA mutase